MTSEEALEFIHGVRWRGSRPGLSRTRELLLLLGDPQKELRFVHVAGTNGKGSTSAMLAGVLSAAGYKTGLYTSPYLSRFNERMAVNGAQITDGLFSELTGRLVPCAEAMEDPPTEFELVTALGMLYFRELRCDVVVLETGMGGRLDSTNIIDPPECAVITRIGLDHTRELGETLTEIAVEKAGIIKPGSDVVIYDQVPEVEDVFLNACLQRGASPHRADFSLISRLGGGLEGQSFRYGDGGPYSLPLLGRHQLCNAAVALEAVKAMRQRGFVIPEGAVKRGLAELRWPARFEIVSKSPAFIVDGGHNPQCAETVAAGLAEYFPDMRHIVLLGVLADKDYTGIIRALAPETDEFIAVSPESSRALGAKELALAVSAFGKPVTPCESIEAGVKLALEKAGETGVACAVGSLYMAGPVRACFGLE